MLLQLYKPDIFTIGKHLNVRHAITVNLPPIVHPPIVQPPPYSADFWRIFFHPILFSEDFLIYFFDRKSYPNVRKSYPKVRNSKIMQ